MKNQVKYACVAAGMLWAVSGYSQIKTNELIVADVSETSITGSLSVSDVFSLDKENHGEAYIVSSPRKVAHEFHLDSIFPDIDYADKHIAVLAKVNYKKKPSAQRGFFMVSAHRISDGNEWNVLGEERALWAYRDWNNDKEARLSASFNELVMTLAWPPNHPGIISVVLEVICLKQTE